MAIYKDLNQEEQEKLISRIRDTFYYCFLTGTLTWKRREGNNQFNERYADKQVGSVSVSKKMVVRFGTEKIPLQDVIWIYANRKLPRGKIVHIDRDRSRNLICNLEDMTDAEILRRKSETNNLSNEDLIKLLPELFEYNISDGKLYWRKRDGCHTFNTNFAGKEAGTLSKNGYVCVKIFDKVYKAHRLIWAYVYGKFPDNHIDHNDKDRSNNKIDNLSDVTQTENNQRMTRATGASGVRGIHYHKKK